MFSRKSTIIATVFIAFMYLVFVPLVYAAKEYKMADYWPFKVGSKWEYNDGSMEVVGTEEINGINTYIVKDTGSCSGDNEMPRFNDENGFGVMMPNGDGTYQTIKVIEPYIEEGDETTASGVDEDGGTFTITFKLKGIANVKVPAGKFKECLKFLVKVEGIDVEEGSYYFAERVYFAEGVGMIKDVRVKESGDTGCALGTESLADFNGIRKLKEYFLAD